MFLTISQPPDLITEPATWHFNNILHGLSGGSRRKVQMIVNFVITKNLSVEVLRSWKRKEELWTMFLQNAGALSSSVWLWGEDVSG
jgi:hypothetical protein